MADSGRGRWPRVGRRAQSLSPNSGAISSRYSCGPPFGLAGGVRRARSRAAGGWAEVMPGDGTVVETRGARPPRRVGVPGRGMAGLSTLHRSEERELTVNTVHDTVN